MYDLMLLVICVPILSRLVALASIDLISPGRQAKRPSEIEPQPKPAPGSVGSNRLPMSTAG